jgi:hypothetical protein
MGGGLASYSEGLDLKYRPNNRQTWLGFFLVLLAPSI